MGNISTFTLERGEPVKSAIMAEQCLSHGIDIPARGWGISPKTPLQSMRGVAPAA